MNKAPPSRYLINVNEYRSVKALVTNLVSVIRIFLCTGIVRLFTIVTYENITFSKCISSTKRVNISSGVQPMLTKYNFAVKVIDFT